MTTPQTTRANFKVERTYNPPLLGRLKDGRYIKIAEFGNSEGHSPAYKGWLDDGTTAIESVDNVIVADTTMIPPTREQMEMLFGVALGRTAVGTSHK